MIRCSEMGPLLAAYAFNALEPDDRARVEDHLDGCATCRSEYARLVELPALLDLAGSADAPIQQPPPLLEASVLAALPRHRLPPRDRRRGPGIRPRARTAIAVGAILALVIAGSLVSLAINGTTDHSRRLALTASAVDPGAHAEAQLRSHPWGTEIDLQARGLAPTRGGQIYEVWLVSSHGRVSAGTFTVGSQGHVTVRLAAAARQDQ